MNLEEQRKDDNTNTFLMFSTIPFFTVPSAPTTSGITSVFICHLYLLFFSISFSAMFLFDGMVISISLLVEFTESLTMISSLFALLNNARAGKCLCLNVTGAKIFNF